MFFKNKFIEFALLFAISLLGFLAYDHFFDIRPSNLMENLPYNAEWDLKNLSENEQQEVNHILNQPFSYQSEGGQSYVFSSRDNKYVVKLFKYKRFRPAWYMKLIPDSSLFIEAKEQHISKRAAKLTTVFMGHKVAYENIQTETGLVFVQLNPSHIPKQMTLTDKVGLSHQLDLGEAAYVLQKKGEMLRRHFSKLIAKGEIDRLKEDIGKVFAVYVSEYHKGIFDGDHGVMQNFGFIDDEQPFHLDVGKFKIEQSYTYPEVYKKDLAKVAERIRIWMRKYYPKHSEEVKTYMEDQLSLIFKTPFNFSNP